MWNRTAGRKVRAIAPDGTLRTATFTGEPDTFFSVPARVQVRGKTVTGFVTDWNDIFTYSGITVPEGTKHMFFPRSDLTNGSVLPAWGKAQLAD